MFELDNLDNFLGSKKSIKNLREELKEKNFKGLYYIYGKKGVGKSTLVDLIIKENDLQLIDIEMTTKEDRIKIKKHFFSTSLIKRVFILDNIDIKSNYGKYKYKKFVDFIIKNQKIIKKNLVFMIGENKKFTNDFKKLESSNYLISRPKDDSILKLIKKYISKNDMETTSDEKMDKLLLPYIKEKQGNLKSILLNLEVFLSSLDKVMYTKKNKVFLDTITIDKKQEVFSIVGRVFSHNDFIQRSNYYYGNDYILPHFVYDNFPSFILHKETEDEDNFDCLYKKSKNKERLKTVYESKKLNHITKYKNMCEIFGYYDLLNTLKFEKQIETSGFMASLTCGGPKIILGKTESQMLRFPRLKLAKKNNLILDKDFGELPIN